MIRSDVGRFREAKVTCDIDGFNLKFTSKRCWKAERRQYGRLLDVIPVTWTKGRRTDGQERVLQEVWYSDRAELERRAADPRPFIVALAKADDTSVLPHESREFVGLFEVVPTGNILSGLSLETEVRRRVRAF